MKYIFSDFFEKMEEIKKQKNKEYCQNLSLKLKEIERNLAFYGWLIPDKEKFILMSLEELKLQDLNHKIYKSC